MREEKMVQREKFIAQLRTVGRCAMVGTLIGLMTTQGFAAGAPTATQPATQPETIPVAGNASTQAIETTQPSNLPLAAAESEATGANGLPEAPGAQQETASVARPIDIKAVMDDAAQNTQNVQPAATQQKPHQVHPAWLVLSAIGGLGMYIGAVGLTKGDKNKGLAAGFLGVGAGLTGLGLYLTFK
jgi:hypothetical protein